MNKSIKLPCGHEPKQLTKNVMTCECGKAYVTWGDDLHKYEICTPIVGIQEILEKLQETADQRDEAAAALQRLAKELNIEDLGPDENVDHAIKKIKDLHIILRVSIKQISVDDNSILHVVLPRETDQTNDQLIYAERIRHILTESGFHESKILITTDNHKFETLPEDEIKLVIEMLEKRLEAIRSEKEKVK